MNQRRWAVALIVSAQWLGTSLWFSPTSAADDLLMAGTLYPYTRGLMASSVVSSMRGQLLPAIIGSPPNPANLPPGCAFFPRCAPGDATCRAEAPPQGTAAHAAACWHPLGIPLPPVAQFA